jgi:pyruvate kinase
MSLHQTGLLARDDPTDSELVRLLGQLDDLLESLEAAEPEWSDWLVAVAPEYRASARNMVHYWAIRQYDLRELQSRLGAFGLSSLGRSEPHVEATLRLVRSAVVAMLEDTWHPPEPAAVSAEAGRELLRRRAVELLGPAPVGRETRIMVTLPSEAAAEPDLVRRLVERGMNVARINCAHDDADGWRAMARHVRQASEETAHRTDPARAARRQAPAPPRRSRPRHRPGARLVDRR